MKHISRLVIACTAVSVLALAGCNTAKQASDSEPPTTPEASSASRMASEPSDASLTDSEGADDTFKTGVVEVAALNSIIANTKSAIAADDFVKASETFEQFEDAWETIEDDIKSKSQQSDQEMKDTAEQVEKALKAKDKPGALKALQELEKTAAKASQSQGY
jgi:hypothetical protein